MTPGLKVFTILGMILGGLTLMSTLLGIGQMSYLLSRGEPLGGAASRKLFTSMKQSDPELVQHYDDQLSAQAKAQREIAPLHLGVNIPYAVALAGLVLCCLMLLLGHERWRRWLVAFALIACVSRIGVGYVSYRITEGAMSRVLQDGRLMGHGAAARGATKDQIEKTTAVIGRITEGLVGVTVLALTVGMCGFWGAMGFVFARRTLNSRLSTLDGV